jgi:hypothetical protein
LDKVPRGSRIAVITTASRCNNWNLTGFDHAPSLAIVRKSAFVNTEWDIAGEGGLMRPIYNEHFGYNSTPSDLLATHDKVCGGRTMEQILAGIPRSRFDYVWTFAPPGEDARTGWLSLVSAGPDERLYRIAR